MKDILCDSGWKEGRREKTRKISLSEWRKKELKIYKNVCSDREKNEENKKKTIKMK